MFTKEGTYIYLIPTESYNGQTSLGLCFKGNSHPSKVNKERISAFVKQHDLKYYNHKVHHAAFALPNYVKKFIE